MPQSRTMPEEPPPPRKLYRLKPKEFERVNNSPRSDEPIVPPAPDHGPTEGDSGRIDVRDLVRQGLADGPLLGNNGPANRENEVHQILRENHAHAEAAGLNAVVPCRRRGSRRRRDYVVLMVVVNTAILALYSVQILIGFQVQCLAARMPGHFGGLVRYAIVTPQLYVIPAAGMIFFSAALTWLMFHVMEDY